LPVLSQRRANQEENGVSFKGYLVIAELRTIWRDVAKEEAAEDPAFKRIHESFTAFRKDYPKDYAVWRQNGYLK
jgi:TRAP-type mannitol/chloroaromatic compound transport system substrate-binding protein